MEVGRCEFKCTRAIADMKCGLISSFTVSTASRHRLVLYRIMVSMPAKEDILLSPHLGQLYGTAKMDLQIVMSEKYREHYEKKAKMKRSRSIVVADTLVIQCLAFDKSSVNKLASRSSSTRALSKVSESSDGSRIDMRDIFNADTVQPSTLSGDQITSIFESTGNKIETVQVDIPISFPDLEIPPVTSSFPRGGLSSEFDLDFDEAALLSEYEALRGVWRGMEEEAGRLRKENDLMVRNLEQMKSESVARRKEALTRYGANGRWSNKHREAYDNGSLAQPSSGGYYLLTCIGTIALVLGYYL